MTCPTCRGRKTKLTVKLIHSNRTDYYLWPKYIPQIKESCAKCGRYLRFVSQTPELIEQFNKCLKEIEIK